MNISPATKEKIIKEYRNELAKRASKTLVARYGKDYFTKLGLKGGRQRLNKAK